MFNSKALIYKLHFILYILTSKDSNLNKAHTNNIHFIFLLAV